MRTTVSNQWMNFNVADRDEMAKQIEDITKDVPGGQRDNTKKMLWNQYEHNVRKMHWHTDGPTKVRRLLRYVERFHDIDLDDPNYLQTLRTIQEEVDKVAEIYGSRATSPLDIVKALGEPDGEDGPWAEGWEERCQKNS